MLSSMENIGTQKIYLPIFSVLFIILQLKLAILQNLVCSFQKFSFRRLNEKLVDYAKGSLHHDRVNCLYSIFFYIC